MPDLTPKRIRSVRLAAGMTQDELALRLRDVHAKLYRGVPGVPALKTTCVQVSRWEAGDREPTGTGREALARLLDDLSRSAP
jgi:transcriptional regulator with XRE-family HTH domain